MAPPRRISGTPSRPASDASPDSTVPVASGAFRGGGEPIYLVIFEQDSSSTFGLPEDGEVVIGRGDTADLRLFDPSVSRSHARLVLSSGVAELTDLGSQNGTRVNGQRQAAPCTLASGDIIEICAATLAFHARVAAAPRAQTATPTVRTLDLGERKVIVADPVMVRVYALLERLARAELPVLVHGETGTGKELAAAAIHHGSPRRRGPFVALNCAAIQESLLESELFGHERGAFTGAASAKAGLLESASGGTVFLDEIGELSAAAQAKLLRALDTKKITRVGDVHERPIDIRVVAATHKDLATEAAAGRFRQDLFFRLSGATVWLPPLRDRPAELSILAQTFLAAACVAGRRAPMAISDAAMQRLGAHPWPGNVRELKSVTDYVAAAYPDAVLLPSHVEERLAAARGLLASIPQTATPLPPPPAVPGAASPPLPSPAAGAGFRNIGDEVRELERSRMAAALEATGGSQKRAAELIGMPLRTFVTKSKQYGLR